MSSSISLRLAKGNEAGLLHRMQQDAFAPLLHRYRNFETGVVCESTERIFQMLSDPATFYYLILLGATPIGGIRIIDAKDGLNKRISPIFIVPQYQGCGYGTQAILLAEQLHGTEHWQLETILQEKNLCRMYEQLGYRRTGRAEEIHDSLTLVYYEK